jgi:hypothetical protein
MSETVDLRLTKPGDQCQYPDGTWGVITAWHYGDGHQWWASRGADGKEYAHNREGRRDRLCQLEFDIIGVRASPPVVKAVEWEKAYTTGEHPELGDIVQPGPARVTGISKFYGEVQVDAGPWLSCERFRLVSRDAASA